MNNPNPGEEKTGNDAGSSTATDGKNGGLDSSELSPSRLMKLGFAFTASRTLLSAVELGVFDTLEEQGALTCEQLRDKINLHERVMPDFADALVALDVLQRDGDDTVTALYRNSAEASAFLTRGGDTSMQAILVMGGRRLYGFWNGLTDALRTGGMQNEARDSEQNYEKMYETKEAVAAFQSAMRRRHLPAHRALARKFNMKRYNTVLDLGGGLAQLACELTREHEHVTVTSLDMPAVTELARDSVQEEGQSRRVVCVSGDFLDEKALPRADVVVMSTVLHGHGLEEKLLLIRKAYDVLRDGGALIVLESLIDDARRTGVEALLMSLNMVIETPGGFDFSAKQFKLWAEPIGFQSFDVIELAPPLAATVAYK